MHRENLEVSVARIEEGVKTLLEDVSEIKKSIHVQNNKLHASALDIALMKHEKKNDRKWILAIAAVLGGASHSLVETLKGILSK